MLFDYDDFKITLKFEESGKSSEFKMTGEQCGHLSQVLLFLADGLQGSGFGYVESLVAVKDDNNEVSSEEAM